jgi:hypothetical protein
MFRGCRSIAAVQSETLDREEENMNLPGFTADGSLYRTSPQYAMASKVIQTSEVVPAFWCELACGAAGAVCIGLCATIG